MSIFSVLFKQRHSLNLNGFIDWHSHILPGVDDGVKTIAESLDILSDYEQMGVKEVWLTPHIMEEIPNSTDKLKLRFNELSNAYKGNIKINLGSENMIDNLFLERLEANDLLPVGEDGNILLVETSYFNAPIRLYETIDAIKRKGYYPLLAHPERYNYIDSISTYKDLKNMGVRFQLNLMSLGGHYGAVVRDKAQKMLAQGMYDNIGSDIHREEHIDIISTMKIKRSVLNCLEKAFL